MESPIKNPFATLATSYIECTEKSVNQTLWAMNPMLPIPTRFGCINSLQWINLLAAGSRTSVQEIFKVQRTDRARGTRSLDWEQAYGVNVDYFITQFNMGIFGRYGRYDNRTLNVFTSDDRLELA